MRWILIEREHGIPLFVGPYAGPVSAKVALDSPLIDSFCAEDAIDIYVVDSQPDYPVETVIIDENDRDHTGL